MELIKKAVRIGNSSGVILPKKLLGSEVKITVVNKPVDIKKETLKLIEEFSENILGTYILNKEPIEILAVSSNTRKLLKTEKIKLSIVPFSIIKKDIKTKPKLKAKLIRAETILNSQLLDELKKEIRGG